MPTWDEYFFRILEEVKTRSPDPRTHVACIFTKNNEIIGTGYNGFASGLDIEVTNENKYPFMIHAEQNCVAKSKRRKNIVAYITHLPCHDCMGLIWQAGVRTIKVPVNRKVFSYSRDDWTVLAAHLCLGLKLIIGGEDILSSSMTYISAQGECEFAKWSVQSHIYIAIDEAARLNTIEAYAELGRKLEECLTKTK